MHEDRKNTEISTVEEWIVKVAELDKMAKLTCLIKDTTANNFIKPLLKGGQMNGCFMDLLIKIG